jgi:Calcineurin-like phosphoesterase
VTKRNPALVPLAAVLLSVSIGCGDSRQPVQPGPTGAPAGAPPAPFPSPAPSAPPAVWVGAGDIATCAPNGPADTARLLDGVAGTVFTAGDNAYPNGSLTDYQTCYEPTWGRHRNRTRPAPGNHEYQTPGAHGYFDYFGGSAGPPGLGYYCYTLGAWHIVSLNSNLPSDERSAQYAWLRADLSSHPSRCSAAYWHHPVITEGPNGDNRHMAAVWRLLHEAGTEVVVAAHDHNYQRFVPLDAGFRVDPAAGMRQFIVGTGGARPYEFPTFTGHVEARSQAWGVIRFTLRTEGYDWEFIAVPGQPFSDRGSDRCH